MNADLAERERLILHTVGHELTNQLRRLREEVLEDLALLRSNQSTPPVAPTVNVAAPNPTPVEVLNQHTINVRPTPVEINIPRNTAPVHIE